MISRHDAAYGYLPASVGAFASPDEFVKLLRQRVCRRSQPTPDLRRRLSVYGAARLGWDGLQERRRSSACGLSPALRDCYTDSKLLMYFDFEDYRPDITPVGRVISWREGVLLSIIVHLAAIILRATAAAAGFPYDPQSRASARRRAMQRAAAGRPRFVFVQPRVDCEALRPPHARRAVGSGSRGQRASSGADQPTNPLPFSRGNTPERVEQTRRGGRRARPGAGARIERRPSRPQAQPDPARPRTAEAARLADGHAASAQTPAAGAPRRAVAGRRRSATRCGTWSATSGTSSSTTRRAAAQFGPAIQFDTKGVEFGPWIRRFIAQVKRNWDPLIPNAAMSHEGARRHHVQRPQGRHRSPT